MRQATFQPHGLYIKGERQRGGEYHPLHLAVWHVRNSVPAGENGHTAIRLCCVVWARVWGKSCSKQSENIIGIRMKQSLSFPCMFVTFLYSKAPTAEVLLNVVNETEAQGSQPTEVTIPLIFDIS